MPDILLFSKYFGYNVGGAERSTLAILKAREAEGARIKVLFVEGVESFNAQANRIDFPASWEIEPIRLCCDSMHFRYWSYVANRDRIIAALARQSPHWHLYTYGTHAPAALLGFRGSSVYWVRDEGGLGWDANYYQGWRRLARDAYALAQLPAKRRWQADLRRGLIGSQVIANSRFMAEEAKRRWPAVPVTIDYPDIAAEPLRAAFAACPPTPPEQRGIVLVGDQQVKGGDIFRRIAARLPHRRFLIFDRAYAAPRHQGNLLLMPWQASSAQVYRHAELVLLPSRWAEAYSRVGREAVILGLPVLGARRGGIPEALEDDPARLLDDVEDIDAWCRRIEAVLGPRD